MEVTCPYCGRVAVLVKANEFYKNDAYIGKYLWMCYDCSAWVGCHGTSTSPLGTLAGWKLRQLRQRAHAEFDTLWESRGMTRHEGYLWLSVRLQIASKDCHIGMLGRENCQRIIDVCVENNEAGRHLAAINDFKECDYGG